MKKKYLLQKIRKNKIGRLGYEAFLWVVNLIRKALSIPYSKFIEFENRFVYKEILRLKSDPDSYCLFDENGSEGRASLSSIRFSLRVMVICFFLAIWLIYQESYTLAGVPVAIFSFFAVYKGQIEGKMSSGYPYLEHTNGMGLMIIFFMILVALGIWFTLTWNL